MLPVSEFDYHLPPGLIAQRPLEARDASRMLLLDRASGRLADERFADLPELLRGDELIVLNNARVIPARLFGHRRGIHAPTAENEETRQGTLPARIEIFLLRHLQ